MAGTFNRLGHRWNEFWKKHDPDLVFAYNSIKLVRIQDRYLGIIHYTAMFLIFCYVVLFAILYQRGYIKLDAPVGAIRLGLKQPSSARSTGAYCTAAVPCVYWEPSEITGYNDGSSLFITTDVTISKYNKSCSDESPTCRDVLVSGPTEYLVGNVDNLAIEIDHAPYTPILGIKFGEYAAGNLQTIEDPDSPSSWSDYGEPFEGLAADTVPIDEFLAAARYNIDAIANNYLDDGSNSSAFQSLSYRRFGGVIVLMINYDNRGGFVSRLELISYQYRPMAIPLIDDYQREIVWTDYPNARTELVRRGVRIVGIMTGQLGLFDFQTLLVQLATSLALVAASKVVVDSLAIYILPRKKLYYKSKYQDTEDFSDLMDRLKAERAARQAEEKEARDMQASAEVALLVQQPAEQTGGPGTGNPHWADDAPVVPASSSAAPVEQDAHLDSLRHRTASLSEGSAVDPLSQAQAPTREGSLSRESSSQRAQPTSLPRETPRELSRNSLFHDD